MTENPQDESNPYKQTELLSLGQPCFSLIQTIVTVDANDKYALLGRDKQRRATLAFALSNVSGFIVGLAIIAAVNDRFRLAALAGIIGVLVGFLSSLYANGASRRRWEVQLILSDEAGKSKTVSVDPGDKKTVIRLLDEIHESTRVHAHRY